MSTDNAVHPKPSTVLSSQDRAALIARLMHQYGCGPIPFVGTENAFYERHLVFDRVIDPEVARARERFEAVARSIRDILAQRWVLTRKTYERENPKRIYYLSMEFLLDARWLITSRIFCSIRSCSKQSRRKALIGLN